MTCGEAATDDHDVCPGEVRDRPEVDAMAVVDQSVVSDETVERVGHDRPRRVSGPDDVARPDLAAVGGERDRVSGGDLADSCRRGQIVEPQPIDDPGAERLEVGRERRIVRKTRARQPFLGDVPGESPWIDVGVMDDRRAQDVDLESGELGPPRAQPLAARIEDRDPFTE